MGPYCIETYRANALRGEFEVERATKSIQDISSKLEVCNECAHAGLATQVPEKELAWERMAVE
jgi:hypothetical protein